MEHAEYFVSFAERLTGSRNRAGLTQTELALQVGVSLRTIQNWEAGSTNPPAGDALRKLSAVLCAPIAYLMGADSEDSKQTGTTVTEEEMAMVQSLRAMNPEMRQAMLAVLKAATPRTQDPIKPGLPIIAHSVRDDLHETAEPAAPPPAAAKPQVHVSYRTHPIMTEHQRRMARKAAAREENQRLTAEAAAALAESLPHAMKAAGLNQASQPSPAVPAPIAGKPRPSAGKSPHPKVQQ